MLAFASTVRSGNQVVWAHRGQATIEFLYVVPIILLLMLASLQFVFIYEAKLTLNYATFSGTRAGALHNGAMAKIQEGLASGLAPLFAHSSDQAGIKTAFKTAKTELADNKLARIEIVNPTQAALNGFKNDNDEIPNDNLMYRSAIDTEDGMNVQDANLLKVRVTYCVRLIVPLVNRMIYGFAVAPPTTTAAIDTYVGGAISASDMLKVAPPATPVKLCAGDSAYPYRVPVTSEAVIRMQSPFKDPLKWTAP